MRVAYLLGPVQKGYKRRPFRFLTIFVASGDTKMAKKKKASKPARKLASKHLPNLQTLRVFPPDPC
jgi:hypothetical protein